MMNGITGASPGPPVRSRARGPDTVNESNSRRARAEVPSSDSRLPNEYENGAGMEGGDPQSGGAFTSTSHSGDERREGKIPDPVLFTKQLEGNILMHDVYVTYSVVESQIAGPFRNSGPDYCRGMSNWILRHGIRSLIRTTHREDRLTERERERLELRDCYELQMERAVVSTLSSQSALSTSGVTRGGPITYVGLRAKRVRNGETRIFRGDFGNGNSCRKATTVGMVRATLSDIRPGSRPTANFAVLMEIDGVVADVYRFGNRQAFNLAFQHLGLDCANWSESVYADLSRAAGGLEEHMLTTFFTQIGWPSALPTSEKDAFVRKVIEAKSRALADLASSNALPLIAGLDKFVDEVLDAGVPLVVIAAYYKDGERVARLLIEKLGVERASRIKIVGEAEVQSSGYGQLVLGEGYSSAFDEQLAAAALTAVAAEKQRIAQEVSSILQISVEIGTRNAQGSKKTIAALRAGAELAERDTHRCLLLASGSSGVQAASRIGMPCVVVRSSLTTRTEFPAARAALDGYGPGSITLSRILKLL